MQGGCAGEGHPLGGNADNIDVMQQFQIFAVLVSYMREICKGGARVGRGGQGGGGDA